MFPRLPRSYRNTFPFRIAATSFVHPDHIAANVENLAPYLDEIEVICFESDPPDGRPNRADIRRLAALASDSGVRYNVHLPIDVSLTDPAPSKRQLARESILKLMELFDPVTPTTHTLHLPFDRRGVSKDALRRWQDAACDQLRSLSDHGADLRRITIETIDYPPDWFRPLVEAMDMPVCLDIGHMLRYRFDLEATLEWCFQRTRIIHLHGVKNGRDHLGLDAFDAGMIEKLGGILRTYEHTVSVEVFSFEKLAASLAVMDGRFA